MIYSPNWVSVKHRFFKYKKNGFEKPSPIQLASIPLLRRGQSAALFARSGMGKRTAVAIAMLDSLQSNSHVQGIHVVLNSHLSKIIPYVYIYSGSNAHGLKAVDINPLVGVKHNEEIDIAVGTSSKLERFFSSKSCEQVQWLVVDYEVLDNLGIIHFHL